MLADELVLHGEIISVTPSLKISVNEILSDVALGLLGEMVKLSILNVGVD